MLKTELKGKKSVPSPAEFEDIISKYAEIYELSECIYLNVIKEFSKIKDLSQLKIIDTKRILEPFLLTWGRMSRVLGKNGCDLIRKKIIELSNILHRFRSLKLSTINLGKEKNQIIKLFKHISSLKSKTRRVGPTGTSKVLHLINPDLFPMWDTKIRIKFKFYKGDAEEYFQFLSILKHWINDSNLKVKLNVLKKKYHKSYIKLIDQYSWYKAWNI